MVDWNKPIEAVEKATGRVVPVTFNKIFRWNDEDTRPQYKTRECPNDMTTNNIWYEDGRDFCAKDAWFVRNVEPVEKAFRVLIFNNGRAMNMSEEETEFDTLADAKAYLVRNLNEDFRDGEAGDFTYRLQERGGWSDIPFEASIIIA